jgi:hypothetical protein
MRHVIYLLVVMNLVYFSWNMLQNVSPKENEGLVRRLPPNVRHLDTIQERAAKKVSSAAEDISVISVDAPVVASPPGNSEVQQGTAEITRVEALTKSEPPGAVAPSSNCHVLGPFPDEPETKAVETRLNQLGYNPRERTSEIQVEAGYWAYLPAMEREEALRITRMLEDNKDRDYLIVKGNAISLGAYDSRSQVDMRLKMLHKYGLEPVVEPRYVTRTAHWLDLELLDDERAVLDTIRGEYPDVQAQEVAACQ